MGGRWQVVSKPCCSGSNVSLSEGEIMRSKGWLFNSLVALAASVMLCAGSPALPQSYPSQPIRIIVPTAPGGVADIAARTLAQGLNEIGKTAVVENRTGGGGAIAAEFVAKS